MSRSTIRATRRQSSGMAHRSSRPEARRVVLTKTRRGRFLRAGTLVAVAADEGAAARVIGRRAHATRGVVIIALRRRCRLVLHAGAAIARRNRDPAAGLL